MEVRKGRGVKGGNYVGTFQSFIRTQAKKPGFVHEMDGGDLVRYIVETDDGIEVPGSFPWDFDDYRMTAALGAFGTPARALRSAAQSLGQTQFFNRLEKRLVATSAEVTAWVPDDSGGWIRTVRPIRGTFPVKFVRITTRDADTDLPCWKVDEGQTSWGEAYSRKVFWTVLVVESGDFEGAAFSYRLDYRIMEEKGKYYIDGARKQGESFVNFYGFHGIDLEKLNPRKGFDDPKNILPESEGMLLDADALLQIVVEDGWVKQLSAAVQTSKVDTVLLDEDYQPSGRQRRKVQKKGSGKTKKVEGSAYVALLKQTINKEAGKEVFSPTGEMRAPWEWWERFVAKHNLPGPILKEYGTKNVYDALVTLGYDQLAERIKEQSRRK